MAVKRIASALLSTLGNVVPDTRRPNLWWNKNHKSHRLDTLMPDVSIESKAEALTATAVGFVNHAGKYYGVSTGLVHVIPHRQLIDEALEWCDKCYGSNAIGDVEGAGSHSIFDQENATTSCPDAVFVFRELKNGSVEKFHEKFHDDDVWDDKKTMLQAVADMYFDALLPERSMNPTGGAGVQETYIQQQILLEYFLRAVNDDACSIIGFGLEWHQTAAGQKQRADLIFYFKR